MNGTNNMTDWLDHNFKEYPEVMWAVKREMPRFFPDTCHTPAFEVKSLVLRFPNGTKRAFSPRTLYYYFIKGRAYMTMPLATCKPGCDNPHHARVIERRRTPHIEAGASA